MIERTKLPNRRLGITSKFEWENHSFYVRVGFDTEGKVKEIFLDQDQGRSGSNIETMLDDFAVSASLNLQFGMSALQLRRKLSNQSDPDTIAATTEALSLFGALIDHAAVIEKNHGREMRAAYAAAGTVKGSA